MIIIAAHTRRPLLLAVTILTTVATLYTLIQLWISPEPTISPSRGATYIPTSFDSIKDNLLNHTLSNGDFGERGRRVQILLEYTAIAEKLATSNRHNEEADLVAEVEELAISMFPWLRTASSTDPTPFRSLRHTFIPNSQGIVIPVGKNQFRFAAHLISSLRDILHSKMPVQVAYAGDQDLPQTFREALVSLGSDIEMLDITTIFDESMIQVAGSWAIKPFAMLSSKFSETILLDADTVLLQDPSVVFSYPGYKKTGTFMFHDRLLWQHAFGERHKWWEKEIQISMGTKINQSKSAKPANTLSITKSKVYMEDYAEEQDSGMVVMDKSRLTIVTALLHICWQNTPFVRRDFTYKYTYGDKESWWFGLELCGVEHTFEENYGSITGTKSDGDRVCSFTIAHPDANDRGKLLWYNGSLLKNKAINTTEFEVPQFWMTNATWNKGATKPDMSCMVGGDIRTVDPAQVKIVRQSVEAAKNIDERFRHLIS